ncbi:hypothetical protein [Nocardia abscessus]|uniref:hypothetical protein n=1 Tax=Nocardia abscessus TaxID=120957 RepID=UPI00068438ED|nr:hypothetical protein [Nocardia abscessus]MCC3328253.1 hypothetical protein [Nocardia abscessus]
MEDHTMTATLATPPPGTGSWRRQLPDIDWCDIPQGPREICMAKRAATDAASEAAGSVLDDLTSHLGESFGALLRFVMTWWTALPSPQLADERGGLGPALSGIREYTSGLQVLLLTCGLIFAAARLALAKRGGVAGEAQESFLMLARAVFASMAFAAIITTGTRAGDAFAEWVLFDASRGDAHNIVAEVAEFEFETRSGLGAGTYLVLFLLGIISMLIQLVMLVLRQALLIVVVAVLPIVAAASGTGPGSQAYKRLLSWSLAFVLWKPVGALVYAIAFTVAGRDQQDPQLVLLGLILLVMTVIVLPALIRLVAPAVAILGGGGGAAAVVAGGAAGIAMAAAGERSSARKVSEGENAPGGGGSGSSAAGGPAGGGGGGGGGRPMPGGGDGAASPAATSAGTGGGNAGGSANGRGGARPTGAGAGKPPSASAAGSGGGEAAGAAGGGVAGAAVMGAQMVKDAAQHTVSAIESQTHEATATSLDPDALGPGEVRR